MGDKSSGEGPPPPSPLTGAYLLVVLPQTHQPQHKDCVIHNLTKGLLTWDKTDCHVDLEKELQTITAQAPEGEEAKNGERLIQFASENLVTEVLIHPQLNTLVQCMRNLLSSFTRHRHIIHAGYTCAGNGAWMLQDGTYSYADFAEMYQEHEVQRVLRAYENTVTVDIHCTQEGDWNNLKGKDPFSKVSRVRLNPKDCVTSTPAIKGFLDFLSPFVTNGSIGELLQSSDVVGNIRFSHPTLYVFPGGQGDAALFGINGFNMLVDGGFARKACFWDFSRHLDRLDAVLMTRLNNGNIQGMTSLLQRKRMDHVYPQIGHFFCNMQERRHPLSPDGDKDRDPLLVSLFDQGQDILGSLRHLQLKPQPCYRDPVLEPVNLYHKVGHGKLDMYVISPAKDSREVREFMAKWTTQDSKLFCSFTKRGGEFNFPLCNKVSICVLLVWQPANPEDNITRLLFPGSTPQHKIFEGLDKLKNLEFMKHAVCSARTLSPSSSSVGLNVRTVSKPKVPASVDKIIENDDKKIEAVKQPIMKPPTGQTEKQPLRSQPPSRPSSKQKPAEKPKEKPKTDVEVKTEKTETAKTEKAKPDKIDKTEAVQKIEKPKEKPKRPITKQPEKKKPIGGEKKDSLKSSPTTPKKIAENKVTEAQPKPEVKSRASSRTKPSPSATPAKSAKEANNRKVFEQKKEATKRMPPAKKEDTKKPERSTAPRRSVPSPSKTDKQQVSPVKPRPVTKPKQDAKKIIKAEKDVVIDSVASTPSTVDVELAKAKEDLAEKETKVDEIKVIESAETTDQPSLSKDEEDEILVIEKIEIEGDGKNKPGESIAVSIRNSREDIIADEEAVKDETNVDLQSDERKEIMKTSDITIPDTDSKQFSEDVQDMTKDAPDTSKSRVEFMTTEEASITKEPATDKLTPREKDGKEKSTDIGDIKQTDESQPDEKFSTTVESGATTAPTLPEDERIPLDEIKEGIEEKYIKEDTKEKDIGVAHRPEQPTSLPEVPIISSTPFDQRVQLLKDIVKTPDEVADLPVHEEADGGIFAVDEIQLARDLHKSRDDLLGIPAPKKTAERKEDAAEEIKLVKDENEKEDATKDLKEDDIAHVQKTAPAVPPATLIDQPKAGGEESLKLDASPQKADTEPAHEKQEVELIDNEAVKSSAIPASLEDEEILDEDKDKETEKEKLIPKESRDLDKNEDVADKASKEMINEKQVAKSVVEEEIKGKKPIPEDETQKEEAEQEGDKQVELLEPKDEQSQLPSVLDGDSKESTDQVTLDKVDEIIIPKVDTKIDHKSKSPSPEPLATVAQQLGEKDLKSPSPPPKDGGAEKKDEETKAVTPSSPELKLGDAEDVVERSMSTSPKPKDEETKDVETAIKSSKSPSPEPKVGDTKDVETAAKASKPPSPEPKAEKVKGVEDTVKASKSPLPEPEAGDIEGGEGSVKASKSPSPEPKAEEVKDVDATVKASKSPSPAPKAQEVEDVEAIFKASKSPSPVPKAEEVEDVEAIVKASKSPSPAPKAEEVDDVEAIVKAPKSPSPAPKAEEVEDVEALVKASKSPSPGPKAEEVKDVGAIVKVSKSPSPEPKAEEVKEVESTIKASKSPSPEPKVEETKDVAIKASKSPSPEPKAEEVKDVEATVEASKSPSPEPKVGETKDVAIKASKSPSPEPKAEEVKDVEATVKASKSPSPEPKVEETKYAETAIKASKSPSPEPKAGEIKDDETTVKAAKPPPPEQNFEETKDGETSIKASKSPSPDPKAEELKDVEAIVEAVKSPSPEPKVEETIYAETAIKASQSSSPEPKAVEVKDVEAIVKASKSPSPEPKVDETKDAETAIKASKSPSPEPQAEEVTDAKVIVKKTTSPSPEPKVGETKDIETAIKASKSPSPEPKAEEVEDVKAPVKAAKSSSPQPRIEEAKDDAAAVESTKIISPEPKDKEAKVVEAIFKASTSPSPEPQIEKADGVEAAMKAESPSPEPKIKKTEGVEIPRSPEPNIEEAKVIEADNTALKSLKALENKDAATIEKVSKSPSPEPLVEVAKHIETVLPEAHAQHKDDEVKDIEAITKASKSPSPAPKDIEEVSKASKSPSPELEGVESVEVGAIGETSKLLSPEAYHGKDINAIDKASKTDNQTRDIDVITKPHILPSPELKAEEAMDADSLIKASKTPEPKAGDFEGNAKVSSISEPKADQPKDIEAPAISPKSTSPVPEAEEAKDIDAIGKAHKSPSPEVDDVKGKDDKPSPGPPSPVPKPEEMKDADPMAKVTSSSTAELNVETTEEVLEMAKISKSPSPEPVGDSSSKSPSAGFETEGTKVEEPKDEVIKLPSPEPIEKGLQAEQSQQVLSKSLTPEPNAEGIKTGDYLGKTSVTPSPEPIAEDLKTVDTSPLLAKSVTPEPSTQELNAAEPEEKLAKSPSPEPITKPKSPPSEPADVKSVVPEGQASKSQSPEPIHELAKEHEAVTSVSKSPLPESDSKKALQSTSPEGTKVDEPLNILSKSPSPEPVTEMAKSPELVTKVSTSSSPEPVTDVLQPSDQKATTPSPEPLSHDSDAKASMTSEPKSESSELPVGVLKSPELQSDASKNVNETSDSKVDDSKLTESTIKSLMSSTPEPQEPVKLLESESQKSKSSTPEPSAEVPKSLLPSEALPIKSQQRDEILEPGQPGDTISKSPTPEPQIDVVKAQETSVKASSTLESHPDISKSPCPEPIARDSKSPSPLPLESVDEKASIKGGGDDKIVTSIKEDASEKKVKTKEELNQELVEEKEVDEVSGPEKKEQANLLAKLDRDGSLKSNESFSDSKAESSKLEAEKHDKETSLSTKHEPFADEDQTSGSPDATKSIDSCRVGLEKQVIDEKEIDQSSTKKLEECEGKEDEKTLGKPSVETKLVSGDLSTSVFKMEDRVPSISLREASIEQTSEELATPKHADVDKAPGDLERDITSTSDDRKLSSGEVSTKSTDVDEKERKLSGTGSTIGSGKSGEVSPKDIIEAEDKVDVAEEVISRIESSVKELPLTKEEEEIDVLEKSIAGDQDKLRKLKAIEKESKDPTKLKLDSSDSTSSAQAKQEENIPESCKDDTKVDEIVKQQSIPESIKLEAEKESVEVRSKDDLKDEALVLDLDLTEKEGIDDATVSSTEDGKKSSKTTEDDLKEQVSKVTLAESLVFHADLDEGGESVVDTIVKSMQSTSPKISHDGALDSSVITSEYTGIDSSTKDLATELLQEQLKSSSTKVADIGKDGGEKDLVTDSTSGNLEITLDESKSDKVGPTSVEEKSGTKVGDYEAEKLSSKSPSPPTVLDVLTKEEKISPESKVKGDLLPMDGDDKTPKPTKPGDSLLSTDIVKSQKSVSPEKSPVMVEKTDSLAEIDQGLKTTTSTPKLPTKEDSDRTAVVSSVIKVDDSKVQAVSNEKTLELDDETLSAMVNGIVSSETALREKEETLVTSDGSKREASKLETVSGKSDEVADKESVEVSQTPSPSLTGATVGDMRDTLLEKDTQPNAIGGLTKEGKTGSESPKADIDISHGSLTTVSIESTKPLGGKEIEQGASLEKSCPEIGGEIKDTTIKEITVKDISSELSEITSKGVLGSSATTSEQLSFATSTFDSKQSLETIEPLVIKESQTATVTVKPTIEKDAGEVTTAVLTKTDEPSADGKILADDILILKSSTETSEGSKAESSLLTNGKTTSDIILETDEKVMKATADGKEHDAKKSDNRVTDILDTAERIVSSLNGKKTISDESSDYIPSFSETKSYSLTIEGKKGPSDEITVETKTIDEGHVTHTEIHTDKDINGHSKLDNNDAVKLDTSSKGGDVASPLLSKSETHEKPKEQSQISTASVEKTEESIPKSSTPKDDSAHQSDEKTETEKPKEPSETVGQALTKVISATAKTISETVSDIDSFVPSDLLKSSSSSTKESTTASPDLSRKSDEQISTSQKDSAKDLPDSKSNLAVKESLIDVTSSFLSMESGIYQDSEKSMDLSGSSSKSGEKETETTDKKSSLSSTQVEPPTEKDQPLVHSATAALRTQKDFSRSETPASDILSDRDIEVGHCTPYSDTSSGQVSRAVTHVWETVEGRPESRHYDSDEDIPGSPMSISSHIPSPPQFEYDMSRPQDPMMMSSFYGSLPEDFEEAVKTLPGDLASAYDYSIHDKGDISLKKELGGDKFSASIRSSLTSTPESSPLPERRFESLLATSSKEPSTTQQAQPSAQPQPQPPSVLPSSSSTPPKPDPIGKWDKPLGLPPPHSTDSSTPYIRWNPYKEWGKPLGLPSPAPPPREDTDVEVDTSGSAKTTPKKVSKMNAENNKYSSNAAKESSNKSKRSESPVKKATGKDSRKSGPTPVYMDLSYVPHHGNSNYATVEFFKRVRARYYVFSGTEPSKEVFNALLEAKQSWEDKDLEVTIIPTYDTDTLGYWIAENEETLSKLKIDLSPSASRCTINLQDHDTSCSAYRLEF